MTDVSKYDFQAVTDFGNLYQAYLDAKSGKSDSIGCQKFQSMAFSGVLRLKQMLETKTYNISPYYRFLIKDPKERIIDACSFKDKIVQHSLCDNVLHPLLKSEFIDTNYAGQTGKGTQYGLEYLSLHMEQAFEKYGCNCWIIKADISKFFYTINHEILKDIVRYHIEDDDVYYLCEKFIDSTTGLGLPLGNQISQVFSLLYLSCFDHFIKDDLGVHFYGRYADDFYLIVRTKDEAKLYLSCIKEFMRTLGLELNGKTQIIPFKNGIRFCGFHTYVTKDGKVIRKLINEKKRAAKKKYRKMAKLVKQGKLKETDFWESYNAFKAHLKNGNCIKFSYEMDLYIEELLKNEIV